MKLSVIVPCYNVADTIATQLEALAGQYWSGSWEVIVADNGSTDGTLAIVEQYRNRLPNLRIVQAAGKRGAAHARNLGASVATGEFLAFCDADDEVAPGWVAAIGTALCEHDFVASRFEGEKLNESWVLRSHLCPQQTGLQPYTQPPFLPHASGCGLGVKRELHEAVHGFDETLMNLQDTDYCWKIQLAGTPLHFAPDALIHLRYRQTLWGLYQQARGWGKYNVLIYKRYRPLGMPQMSWKYGAKAWRDVLRRLIRIRNKQHLAQWLWRFGWRVGRLQGCIQYRVFAP